MKLTIRNKNVPCELHLTIWLCPHRRLGPRNFIMVTQFWGGEDTNGPEDVTMIKATSPCDEHRNHI